MGIPQIAASTARRSKLQRARSFGDLNREMGSPFIISLLNLCIVSACVVDRCRFNLENYERKTEIGRVRFRNSPANSRLGTRLKFGHTHPPMQTPPSVTPYVSVFEMVLAHWNSFAICAVARLGVADHLESGPKTTK